MTQDPHRALVIGIGNLDRGDDGAGRAVARLAKEQSLGDTAIIEANGNMTELLDAMAEGTIVFLVDASLSGAAPGTIRRFDVAEGPLPQEAFATSTHGLGLALAVELARVLGRLPPHCIVFAIEGASFEIGARLSPAVEAAMMKVADRLRCEIASIAPAEAACDA